MSLKSGKKIVWSIKSLGSKVHLKLTLVLCKLIKKYTFILDMDFFRRLMHGDLSSYGDIYVVYLYDDVSCVLHWCLFFSSVYLLHTCL